jgi:hypothetical protein
LIQIFLKACKESPDLFRPAQIGHRVGDGVVVFEPEQRRQLFLVEFPNTHTHVMREHEVEEDLLLAIEVCADFVSPLTAAAAPSFSNCINSCSTLLLLFLLASAFLSFVWLEASAGAAISSTTVTRIRFMGVSPSRRGWDSDEAECFYVKPNGKSIVVRRVCFHTEPCLDRNAAYKRGVLRRQSVRALRRKPNTAH